MAVESGIQFEQISLDDLLDHHTDKAREINELFKPFQYFEGYMQQGYCPYYKEESDLYFMRLGEVVNMMLEIELPLLRQIEVAYVAKIKQLLATISKAVPFVPNVSKLSERIGINRSTLLSYLHYLNEIDLTRNLFRTGEGISLLQKPSKIYLENTNIIYLLAKENAERGNLRETFFANQLGYAHDIAYAEEGDFTVDNQYIFEIGGKDKTDKQIKGIERAFIASDGIIHGFQNKIPLWLFGFLY